MAENDPQQESKLERILKLDSITWSDNKNKNFYMYPKLLIKISLLGQSGVGKTTYINRCYNHQSVAHRNQMVTVSCNSHCIYLDELFEEKYAVTVQVLDCPGTDRYESVTNEHFRDCHGAILMADETTPESFQRLKQYWLKRLRESARYEKHVKVVLVCNKMDVHYSNSSSLDYKTQFRGFDKSDWHEYIPSFLISASRGDNVKSPLKHLIEKILQDEYLVKDLKSSAVYHSAHKLQKHSCCCDSG